MRRAGSRGPARSPERRLAEHDRELRNPTAADRAGFDQFELGPGRPEVCRREPPAVVGRASGRRLARSAPLPGPRPALSSSSLSPFHPHPPPPLPPLQFGSGTPPACRTLSPEPKRRLVRLPRAQAPCAVRVGEPWGRRWGRSPSSRTDTRRGCPHAPAPAGARRPPGCPALAPRAPRPCRLLCACAFRCAPAAFRLRPGGAGKTRQAR